MKELCPVCKTEYSQNVTKCEVCGFTDELGINRKWIIVKDAENWIDTVVKPYHMRWHKQIKELQESNKRLQNDQVPRDVSDNSGTDKLGEIRKKIAMFQGCISAGSFHTVGLKSDGRVVAIWKE